MQSFDFDYMVNSVPPILKGAVVSLSIALVAIFCGLLIGLSIALIKINRVPFLSQAATVYVSFLRGTPLLVQILLCYYGLPILLRSLDSAGLIRLDISGLPAIVFIYISLSLNVSAFLSETIRGAILAVPKGQLEAAWSIGMTGPQAFRRVIMPQALIFALPNFGNIFISILKDTSLAFVASVPEILGQAKIIAGRTSKFFEVYIVAALVYWLMCIFLEIILKRLEQKSRRHLPGDGSC